MISIDEYLLSKSNPKLPKSYIPEIGEIATDQFGDDWNIEDYCSILHQPYKLEKLIDKYDESKYFSSWVKDEFNAKEWCKEYKVDDAYAVAVTLANNRTSGQMKKAIYVWGPDDLWYRDDTNELKIF